MSANRFVFLLAAFVLIPLGMLAQQKYVPTPNEELYGTWVNTVDLMPQERIVTASGIRQFLHTTDTETQFDATLIIDSKWVDSEGRICYKTHGTETSGYFKGSNWQGLERVSKDGKVYESTWVSTGRNAFNPQNYPGKIDPKEPEYRLYYRTQE